MLLSCASILCFYLVNMARNLRSVKELIVVATQALMRYNDLTHLGEVGHVPLDVRNSTRLLLSYL
jgi:hypothetical protein